MISGAAYSGETGLFLRRSRRFYGGNAQAVLKQITVRIQNFDLSDFRRTSERGRLAMLAAAGAVLDAGKSPPPETTVIGYTPDGAYPENLIYFSDYAHYGRETGRGSLFVPTLSTTPLCETAIMLGLHGPVWGVSGGRSALREELAVAQHPLLLLILRSKSAAAILLEDV